MGFPMRYFNLYKKVEKNRKKVLTMGRGCGNINELRQEECVSTK